MIPNIDIAWLIEQMGGVRNLSTLYMKHLGTTVLMKTIQKWRERNSITLNRLYEIRDIAKAEGIDLTPAPGGKFVD